MPEPPTKVHVGTPAGSAASVASTLRYATHAADSSSLVHLVRVSWLELISSFSPPSSSSTTTTTAAPNEEKEKKKVDAAAIPEQFLKMMNQSLDQIADQKSFDEKFGDPDSGKGAFWVAQGSDGKARGCVACVKQNDFELELIRMVVDPEHRREGLGKILVNAVCEYAKQAGYANVFLTCGSTSGQGLYHACGFRVVETSRIMNHVGCRFVRNMQPYRFRNVLVTGGVHGNELIGSQLVCHWSGGWHVGFLCVFYFIILWSILSS